MSSIITLTSDFGVKDAFVASVKGVILRINPQVQIIDISNEIAPQDIWEAAGVLSLLLPKVTTLSDRTMGYSRLFIKKRNGSEFTISPRAIISSRTRARPSMVEISLRLLRDGLLKESLPVISEKKLPTI